MPIPRAISSTWLSPMNMIVELAVDLIWPPGAVLV